MKKFDWPLFVLTIVISLIGTIMILSSSHYIALVNFNDSHYFFKKQIQVSIVGFVSMIFFVFFSRYKLEKRYKAIYISSIVLLLLTHVLGQTNNNIVRFISVGNFSFLPSALAKIGIIISLSKFVEINNSRINEPLILFKFAIFISIPVILLLLQPHYYVAITYIIIAFTILLASNVKLRYLIIGLILSSISILVTGKISMTEFRKNRLKVWKESFGFSNSYGKQVVEGRLAIASGGLFGVGLGRSMQKYLYIPNPHNDFIFAIICEELGFLGSAILLILYGLIIYRLISISNSVKDQFSKIFLYSVIAMLITDVVGHIGVNVGVLPVISIPLPFISYGGSYLIAYMMAIGIALGIKLRNENCKVDIGEAK